MQSSCFFCARIAKALAKSIFSRDRREACRHLPKRKGVDRAQAERWLASNLDYDPE